MLLSDGREVRGEKQDDSLPFFRLAFRPLFWLGALFSVVSIALWSLSFTGYLEISPFGGSLFWHQHEMLFGFAAAIIAGFLLTAVQTWTGVPSVKGKPLAVLVSVWLLARVLLLFPPVGQFYLVVAVDLLFLPMAAVFLSFPIVKARLWRNLFFVPILLLMAVLNGLMHLSAMGVIATPYQVIGHTMVLTVTLVMCIMGGRVFPMFTANGTGTARVAPVYWLEKLSIATVIFSVLVVSELLPLAPGVDAAILIIAGLANFLRALRWRIWVTFSTPLVWSLHLSYLALCAGLLMLGMEKLELLQSVSPAYHTITVGGMGLMILSMISRVSLGHTGRLINVGAVMTTAFALLLLSFFFRVFASVLFGQNTLFILMAAAFWVFAYGAFVLAYAPVLFSPRIDGRSG